MKSVYLLVVRNLLQFSCGPKDNGRYDFCEACSTCGTGARRIDPISLPISRLRHCVSQTLDSEVVIPPRLVSKIMSLAPQCLRVIVSGSDKLPSEYYELVPELILPPWDETTTGWEMSRLDPPCSRCKRDGYYNIPHIPLLLRYKKPIPSFHVAATYECFGRSGINVDFRESHFAASCLVISGQMKDILSRERGLEFYPVEVTK